MEWKTLTPPIQRALSQLTPRYAAEMTEIRFRIGRPVQVVCATGEEILSLDGRPIPVTDKLLRELMDRATGFSAYALRTEEGGLYLPLENGCRMGICGEAVLQDGIMKGLRNVSSLVIRLAKEYPGIASKAASVITSKGYVQSVLIVSPPGKGKTTFLRDLIRCVSEAGWRVCVADERRELASARDGVPQMDLGPMTDVLTGCPKFQAMSLLLRVMNPQVIAVDELSGPDEIQMAMDAANSGVAVFATAHSSNLNTLRKRSGYGELLKSGVFPWCVTLSAPGQYQIERLDAYVENPGSLPGRSFLSGRWLDHQAGSAAAAEYAKTNASGPGTDAGRDGAAYATSCRAV